MKICHVKNENSFIVPVKVDIEGSHQSKVTHTHTHTYVSLYDEG